MTIAIPLVGVAALLFIASSPAQATFSTGCAVTLCGESEPEVTNCFDVIMDDPEETLGGGQGAGFDPELCITKVAADPCDEIAACGPVIARRRVPAASAGTLLLLAGTLAVGGFSAVRRRRIA